MDKTIKLIILILFTCSCSNFQEGKRNELIMKWNNKEIRFPQHSVFTIQGKDTINFDSPNTTYKIVTYIDSIGCMSCKLQLKRWNEFIQQIKQLKKDKNVTFYFYFAPQNQRLLQLILRKYNFTYPICIDNKKEFNKLNKFPQDIDFQTFLIDKNNKILISGNPIHNEKIKNLYLKVIINNGLNNN